MIKNIAVLGILVLPAAAFAEGAPAAESGSYIVSNGDSLWSLAGKFYGNPDSWRIIYDGNRDAIKNPHWIFPGQKLSIPDSPSCPPPGKTAGAAPAPVSQKEAEENKDAILVKNEAVGSFEEVGAERLAEGEATKAAKPEKVYVTMGGGSVSASQGKPKAAAESSSGQADIGKPKTVVFKDKTSWGNVPEGTLSDSMPPDQTWDFAYEASREVPADWTNDGIIKSCNPDNDFDESAVEGETVIVSMKGAAPAAGDSLTVYRRGDFVRDAQGNRTGLRISVSALLEVEKVDGGKIFARIKKMTNPVANGDLIKKE